MSITRYTINAHGYEYEAPDGLWVHYEAHRIDRADFARRVAAEVAAVVTDRLFMKYKRQGAKEFYELGGMELSAIIDNELRELGGESKC